MRGSIADRSTVEHVSFFPLPSAQREIGIRLDVLEIPGPSPNHRPRWHRNSPSRQTVGRTGWPFSGWVVEAGE